MANHFSLATAFCMRSPLPAILVCIAPSLLSGLVLACGIDQATGTFLDMSLTTSQSLWTTAGLCWLAVSELEEAYCNVLGTVLTLGISVGQIRLVAAECWVLFHWVCHHLYGSRFLTASDKYLK